MKTGFSGTFVISWTQTEVDGLEAAPVQSLNVGAAWSWRGDVVRVDGPSELLRLRRADGDLTDRKRAARMVRRLVGAAITHRSDIERVEVDDPPVDNGFVVTDGAQCYTITLIEVGPCSPPLLMFLDEIPPRDTEMWIVHHSLEGLRSANPQQMSGGVICFTPGTRIETPEGPRLVEELREGDRIQTKDNGAQPIEWVGSRRMTGARLFAMPRLRPVRIRAGALGVERPDQELLVSPEHRMMVKGDVAQSLFNLPEVLVSARDLINNSTISVDLAVREVTYIHLLLPQHQVLWANGVETESFHPANTSLDMLDAADKSRLLNLNPRVEVDPLSYGSFARRNLSSSEAAILAHEAA